MNPSMKEVAVSVLMFFIGGGGVWLLKWVLDVVNDRGKEEREDRRKSKYVAKQEVERRITEMERDIRELKNQYVMLMDELRETNTLLIKVIKGTVIGHRNDTVIFEALRNNHINGESEEQELVMQEYYRSCVKEYYMLDNDDTVPSKKAQGGK